MTDSLFLIQRYWGSDDDDEPGDKNLSNKLRVSEDKTSNKRKKLSDHVIELDNDIEEILLDKNSLTSEVKSSKRRRKSSVKNHLLKCTDDESQQSILPNSFASENIAQNDSDLEEIQELNCSDPIIYPSGKSSNLIKTSDLAGKNSETRKTPQKNKNHLPKSIHDESQNSMSPNSLTSKHIVQNNSVSRNTEDASYDSNEKVEVRKKKSKGLKKLKEKECKLPEGISSNTTPTKNAEENFCPIGQVQQQKAVTARQALPDWLSNPNYIDVNLDEEKTLVSELNYLDSNTKKNLKEAGIELLFPVQLAVIPWLTESSKRCLLVRPSDICVSAPTGSGKTLAFVLPIVQSLKERVVCAVRALVVLPVNELAIQVFKVFEAFTRGTDLKVALLTGQKSFLAEQNCLVRYCHGDKVLSLVDIVVTTPGRIYDHIYKTRGFCLKRLRYLVIDEADRMMDEIQQGWLRQVEDAVFQDCRFPNCVYNCSNIQRTSAHPTCASDFGNITIPLQKLLYSATLTHDPELLHSLSLYRPKLFTASSNSASDKKYTGTCTVPDKLTMLQVVCEEGTKPVILCHLIKQHQFKRILCFTESVERAHRLKSLLEEMGFQVREISSLNRAVQRKIAINQFTSGRVNILVCSDLVARGIDIANIDCVISYDVPQSVKVYIHRIGRTARAGKSGTAVTLLSDGEMPHFKKVLKSAGIEMPRKVEINSEELKPFIDSYQKALLATDAKLKKEKALVPGNPVQKIQRKRV